MGYPKGSAAELLDGALKLRCCTTPFSSRFPTWSLPPVGNGRIRSLGVATGHSVDDGSNMVKRVRLNRKTHVGVPSVNIPDQGHLTSRRWKRLRPLPPKEWGVRLACLAIFFLDLELGEVFAPGDAWNLLSEGKGVGFLAGWSVQPKGSVHWH